MLNLYTDHNQRTTGPVNAHNHFQSNSENYIQKMGTAMGSPMAKQTRRPITLLNTVYKIASGCIAYRILDKLINADQNAFFNRTPVGQASDSIMAPT